MSKQIVCLMGPTASGKTALACALVQQFPCEIISVDSAMIYRGMDIGTAKPDAETLMRAPHHLVDILDPADSYSAAQFCRDTIKLCESIIRQGKIPLLVGGTMMYFHALQHGMSALPTADEPTRELLTQQAQRDGWPHMHQLLTDVDPEAAIRIHPHDAQRIQRALEVYQLTGKPMSTFMNDKRTESTHAFVNLILFPDDRAWLHQRIALRFEHMLKDGLVDEVRCILAKWDLTASHPAMRCVGYRQVFDYLHGESDEASLCAKGIAATRQLAKRQLTWLRHWTDGHRFVAENPVSVDGVVELMKQILDNDVIL